MKEANKMKVCKYKSIITVGGEDDIKSAMGFVYRVLSNNLNYKMHNSLIADGVCERLKDICNWLNRPAGAKYIDAARMAYAKYNMIN